MHTKSISIASRTQYMLTISRLPRLGNFLKTDKGEVGITFRAYNDPPSVKDREIADEIHLVNTELLMMDYNCPKIKDLLWYADIEGKRVCFSHSGVLKFGSTEIR